VPHHFNAVIFDLDGTLIDSLADLAAAVNHALEGAGFGSHPVDAYRLMVGDGAPVLIQRALPPSARDPETIRRLLDSFEAYYADHFTDHSRPYDGIVELLAALAGRGLATAVVSNKPHAATLRCVATLLAGHCFGAVLGARDGVPRKPDPACALEAATLMGIAPQYAVYLGDSGVDMQTAKAAGMCAVGALWGFRSREELREAGSTVQLHHPLELLPLLDQPLRRSD